MEGNEVRIRGRYVRGEIMHVLGTCIGSGRGRESERSNHFCGILFLFIYFIPKNLTIPLKE